MKRIQKLPTQLANQIAAGEVIERPASVLKELLENSIDAGSRLIEITLSQGGLKLIRVQDDGGGICKEDLALALSQHATSKIQSLSDLEAVESLGFRGEALASIAAVSRLTLTSSVENQEMGWSINAEGRESTLVLKPAPNIQGTWVEVRDLFYNTPARRKFLRSEKTELNYLEETFKRIALSQPRIAFVLKQNETQIKRLPVCLSKAAENTRVATLCGQSFISKSSYIEAESNGLKLKGWLGSPEAHRAQADLQYFYVNGRVVRDKLVSHAIRQVYQAFCPPGRYPAYLLFFDIEPEAVDVNVHPTKHEVRFREARSVHAFLTYSIEEALRNSTVSGSQGSMGVQKSNSSQNRVIPEKNQPTLFGNEFEIDADGVIKSNDKINSSSLSGQPGSEANHGAETKIATASRSNAAIRQVKLHESKILSGYRSADHRSESNPNHLHSIGYPISLDPICLVGDGVLLAYERTEENKEKNIFVADVKALHRLYCKKLLSDVYQNSGKKDLDNLNNSDNPIEDTLNESIDKGIQKRTLLMPKSITVTEEIIKNLELGTIHWNRLGFDFSPCSKDTLLLRKVPSLFKTIAPDYGVRFRTLLMQTKVSDAIELIADYISHQGLELKEASTLLQQYIRDETYIQGDTNCEQIQVYRKMRIDQFKGYFFKG